MTRAGAAVLVLEMASTAAIQAAGIGGSVALGVCLAIILATGAYLISLGRRPSSVSGRLEAFLAQRRAAGPADEDRRAQRDHDFDTMDCYRRVVDGAVRARLRDLRRCGLIGSREERRLSHPRSVGDLESLVTRLSYFERLDSKGRDGRRPTNHL
jgi:hypothetical protein